MSNPKAPADPIDARLVRRLAAILNDTGLTEIEVERGDLKIRVARAAPNSGQTVTFAQPMSASPAPAMTPVSTPSATLESPSTALENAVKSPMVGTVYLSPQPGSEPFVKVGDMIEEGQTLLIIEAMKTMNPIPAPRSGRLLEMLVTDAQPVEFGEALAVIA